MTNDEPEQIFENIRAAANCRDFQCRVSVDSREFTEEQRRDALNRFWSDRQTAGYRLKNSAALKLTRLIYRYQNRNTELVGKEKLRDFRGGAIITNNYFHVRENAAAQLLAKNLHKKHLYTVCPDSVLGQTGMSGALIRYADIIPISGSKSWMRKQFPSLMSEALKNNHLVLMYPEQEMWLHYRKPRPLNDEAYYYAAKNHVPVISCFTELRELPGMETPELHKTQYVLHVLGLIYPDKGKSARENSSAMCREDYRLKKDAYERIYKKALTYEFSPWDIAGWVPKEEKRNSECCATVHV